MSMPKLMSLPRTKRHDAVYARYSSHKQDSGIRSELHPGSLDRSFDISDSQFLSLYPSLVLQRPVGSTLGEAMAHLLDQALRHQYPKHPIFGQEIKAGKDLQSVLAVCQEAAHTQDGRFYVEDAKVRKVLKNICDPLELGSMGETHFVLDGFWGNQFNKALTASGKTNPDVSDLRQWINQPDQRGLPKEIENLLIIVYAEQTNRFFVQFGGNYIPKLDDLPGILELRQGVLPEESDWQETRKRMSDLFGDDISKLLNASNMASLSEKMSAHVTANKANCASLADRLQLVMANVGIPESEIAACDRVKTAKAARSLLNACDGIQIDAPATVASFLQRMGRTGRRAGTRCNCLFLATNDEGLLRAAALLDLWGQGYVEPVNAPSKPYHSRVPHQRAARIAVRLSTFEMEGRHACECLGLQMQSERAGFCPCLRRLAGCVSQSENKAMGRLMVYWEFGQQEHHQRVDAGRRPSSTNS